MLLLLRCPRRRKTDDLSTVDRRQWSEGARDYIHANGHDRDGAGVQFADVDHARAHARRCERNEIRSWMS